MKYLKTFENYDGSQGQAQFAQGQAQFAQGQGQAQFAQGQGQAQAEFPELENSMEQKRVLTSAFEKLSPAEQDAAFKGVEELAAKLGCTVEDLTDPSFLEADFQEAGAQSSMEEGLIGDTIARTKKFFGNLLNGLGIVLRWGGALAGSITTILGIVAGSPDYRIDWMWNEALRNLSSGEQAGMFVGGLAALTISIIVGHMLSNKGKEMAR